VEALALWTRLLPPGRAVESQAAYLAVLERDPGHRQALSELATATMDDRPEESMEYGRRIAEAHPRIGEGYLVVGHGYERLGDPEAAAAEYRRGLEAVPKWRTLIAALNRLENGRSVIVPLDRTQPSNQPETEEAPIRPSAPEVTPQGADRSVGPGAQLPEPPARTPEVVQPYHEALEEFRALVEEYDRESGQTYQGIQDFDSYADESTNWMAWRYRELGQQYDDAGQTEQAEEVMDAGRRRFPEDRLLREQRGRNR
jgi:tetratricopeptide (TPR) repeat protein